jgi:hypothetical protein
MKIKVNIPIPKLFSIILSDFSSLRIFEYDKYIIETIAEIITTYFSINNRLSIAITTKNIKNIATKVKIDIVNLCFINFDTTFASKIK